MFLCLAIGACAYVLLVLLALIWNHGAHRLPTPKIPKD